MYRAGPRVASPSTKKRRSDYEEERTQKGLAARQGPAAWERWMSQRKRKQRLSVRVGHEWDDVGIVEWKLVTSRTRVIERVTWLAAGIVVAILAFSVITGEKSLAERVLDYAERLTFLVVGWAIRGFERPRML